MFQQCLFAGGPMLAGHVGGQKTQPFKSMFEAVGANAAGQMTEEEVA